MSGAPYMDEAGNIIDKEADKIHNKHTRLYH